MRLVVASCRAIEAFMAAPLATRPGRAMALELGTGDVK